MFPGIGGMDPKHMGKLMQQMGIKSEEVSARRVVIERDGGNIIIESPQITKISMRGESTYQIAGKIVEVLAISEEDAKLVSAQAGCSLEEAKKALESCNGDIAEAIVKLQEKGQ